MRFLALSRSATVGRIVRQARAVRALAALVLAAFFLSALTGCPPGRGNEPAAFTLPKNRILVFVDTKGGNGVPADVPTAVASGITKHLYKYKAADTFVNPEIIGVIQGDVGPAFDEFDVMTVARKAGADTVILVQLWRFQAESISEGLLTEGGAEGYVWIVDSQGRRVWPQGDKFPINASVPPQTSDVQTVGDVKTKLIEDLTVKTGRLFHEYSRDDRYFKR